MGLGDDDWDRPRKRGRTQHSPSTARILAGVGICVGAAVLFVVGIIILVRAVNNKDRNDNPPEPGNDEKVLTLDEAIRHLNEGHFFDVEKAVKALTAMPVDPRRRGDVVAALKGAIDNRQKHLPRNEMFDVLAKWATADDVPYLMNLLDDADGNVRVKSMYVLGKLKDPRAVDPLAQRLVDHGYRPIASQALKDIGPAAEKAVADFLGRPDPGLQIEACRILKVIGGKASHAALVKLAWDDNEPLAQAAREALPPEQRPPIYTMAQTMFLSIQVPDLAAWAGIEKKLRSMCEGEPVMFKYSRSGDFMSVRLAPVSADPAAFAARIDFGKVGSIAQAGRVINVTVVK
jgi:hypothetical protein